MSSNDASPPANYYGFFDNETGGDGKVFTLDLSSEAVGIKMLTEQERDEREAWSQSIQRLKTHYYNRALQPPVVSSWETLLQQRLVAPILGMGEVSSRSSPTSPRKGRMYPPTINAWSDFAHLVNSFVPENKTVESERWTEVFLSSLENCADAKSSEKNEESSILGNLERTLVAAGIVHGTMDYAGVGKKDFNLIKDELRRPAGAAPDEISVVGETKSTHNLLLPITADVVVQKYNQAYRAVIGKVATRTQEWIHICHPLAQLLGYMADNGRRCGALTSATRTYFIHITGSGDSSQVYISDAWFVGQVNYLRAWAYVHHLGCDQTVGFHPPTGVNSWVRTDKNKPTPQPPTPESDSGRDGDQPGEQGSGGNKKRKVGGASAVATIPNVSLDDIDVIDVIGGGRNGAVFRARWEGKEVAMKQFDIGRDGTESFDKELAAYLKLMDVWGVLVPKPIFLAESVSGGVMFLGMQLGRDPSEGDDVSCWPHVLSSLEGYGIRHNDCWGRNGLFVTDDSGTERLVAIDLEDYDELY